MGLVASALSMNHGQLTTGGASRYVLINMFDFNECQTDAIVLFYHQSSLPNNGVPFAIILYADKTHLSSSGAVKGYPVIACCANLPIDIRNQDGIGGG
jgi:hypothetical protein